MKTTLSRRFLTLAAIVALGFQASAQSLYWDSDGTGAGNDCGTGAGLGGSGTWDTISALWALDSNCAGGDTTYTTGTAAVFSGTAGTVNLTGPITAGNMTFNTAGYVISNNANFAANTLTLSGGSTITVPSGTVTNVAVVNGTGGYTLSGPGTLYLPSTNNITGPINVGSGSTLRIRESFAIGGNTGDVTLNGGTLQTDDNGTIDTSLNLFPGGATGKNIVIGASGGTIDFANTGGGTQLFAWGGAGTHINGSGPLLITASGGAKETLRMTVSGNTFSKLILRGPICYQTSSGSASDDTVLGALPGSPTPDALVISNNAVLMFNANPTIQFNRGITIGSSAGDNGCFGFAIAAAAGSINSVITGPGNVNIQNSNGGYLNGSSGGLVNFNATNTYTGSTIINGGILVVNGVGSLPHTPLVFNPSGSTSWTSSRALVVTANQTVPSLTGATTAGAGNIIRMQNNAILTVGDDNTSTPYSGVVTSSTGSGTFVKAGTGILTISNKWTLAQNANQGHIIITNGTIKYGNSTAGVPSQGTTAGAAMTHVASGATLDANNQGATIAALEGAGNVINAGNVTLDGTNATGAANFTGNITGANGGNHTGSGTQTLGGTDNFANFTNTAGRINFNSQGAPGVGVIRINGSSTVGSTLAGSVTITNSITVTNTKVLTVASGTGNSVTFSGVISDFGGGPGQVSRTTADSGIVTLSGNNTFTGGVNLTGGQLNIAHVNALGTGIFTNNNAAGSFDNGSAGDLTINNTTYAQGGGLHYVGANFNMTLNNPVLSGSGGGARTMSVAARALTLNNLSQDTAGNGFAKSGAGTLVLTGTATYTGNATASAGTLRVDGSIAASSNVTMSASSTLQGNGILPTVVISSGATIAAGDSVGTLSVTNSLTINAGSTNVWEMTDASGAAGSGYDTINANSLTISGSFSSPIRIMISSLGSPAANFPGAGSWTLIHTTNGVTGFDSRYFTLDTSLFLNSLDPNKAFRITQSGNDIVLTYIDPAITADPTNTVVQHGTTATFTVSAVGASLSYQWQKGGVNMSNGGNISGVTASALSIANVADSDIASYDVVVTDSTIPASVTSASAVLDIADAPSVTVNPTAHTVGVGTNTQFIISWNGSADDILKHFTTFKWKTNSVNIADGAKYSGTTTSNLTVINPSTNDAVTYSVALTNQFGTTSSSGALLGVDLVPTISQQPTGTTIAPYGGFESNNTKVVAAGGDLSYQWYQGTPSITNVLVEDPNNLVGTMTAQLLITNAVDTNSGSYFVIITNYAGSITSALATITIPVDPVISISPASRSAVTGSTTVFSATASGKPNLFYHWKKDGVNLIEDGLHVIGANTATLTLANLTTADTASTPGYVLEVTNDFNAAFADSTAATLTVFDPVNIGATFADGVSGGRTYTNGNQITLSAPVTGTSLTYQWKKGSANVQNGANISGSQSAVMTVLSAFLTNQGSYTLVASNWNGAATSSPPAVVVVNQPVLITVQPSSVTIDNPGKGFTFSVTATGNPLAYQWYFNSNAIAGATSSTYHIASVSSANIGYYHVVVNNLINSQTSVEVTLKIGSFFYADDLTTDTSANWNVYSNRTDGVAAFAFDYSLHNDNSGPGIPQNPNTSTSKALYLAINYAPTTLPDSITLTPTAINATGDYEFSFDVFMNYLGNALGAQTAQSMTAALGCANATTNGTSELTNGVCVSANCDDQVGADFVIYRNTSATTASAAAANNVFNATGSFPTKHINAYYSFLTGGNSAAWPATESQSTAVGAANQTGTQDIGTFGLAWHHCVIKRFGNGTGTTNTTWYIDGVPIGTITNAYYSPSATSISLGQWATFAGGGSANWEFSLFNNVRVESFSGASVAPTVVTPFSGATANAGSIATLSVVATSPTALHYQWFRNGSTITDATNSTYSITNVLAADAGPYSVTVYNESTFVDGGSGVLTVNDPAINAQPANATVECGSSPVVSVGAGGTGTLTYQWYTPNTAGTAIGGATDSSLTIANVSGTNSYAVIVTGTYGSVTSSTATLSAVDTTGPVITLNGSNPDTACQTVSYVDPSATANDACEGAVAVVPSGSVDTSTLGDYTLTYTATDSVGNSTSTTRLVHVVFCAPAAITSIVTAPTVTTNVPQGTNVSLTVNATGQDPKAYQWYLENVAINNATNSTYSFIAGPIAGSTNQHYTVSVSNLVNSVTSSPVLVKIVIDSKLPGLTLTLPKGNARSNSTDFIISGTATDIKAGTAIGNVVKVYYNYTNHTFGGGVTVSQMYTNDISANGTSLKRPFTFSAVAPPAGTNDLSVWSLDLAGNSSAKPVTIKGLFSRETVNYKLTIGGDGAGLVTATTKGGPGEHVTTGMPTQDATGLFTIPVYKYQLYTFTFAPDVKPTNSILSVVSNASYAGPIIGLAGTKAAPNTDTIKKVLYTFMMGTSDANDVVSFNRNRKIDMAGSYTGVFSVTGDPQIASSGLLQNMTIGKTGTYSAKVVNNGLTTTIKGVINADGTTITNVPPYTLTGYLDWANSATSGGVKQFKGTVSSTAGWNSDVTADRAEKNILLTAAAKSSMLLPGGTVNGPSGSSFAKMTDSLHTRTFTFSLADNASGAVASAVPVSASSNFPIYVYSKYKTGDGSHSVLFGTWNYSSNQVNLNWIKGAGGTYNPAGFSNAILATVSAKAAGGLTGPHTVTITNDYNGFGLSYLMDFGAGAPGTAGVKATKLSGPTNSIVVVQDPFGKLTVTFGNGSAKKTTIGYAGTLEDAQNGEGFFIPTFPLGLTNSGSIKVQ